MACTKEEMLKSNQKVHIILDDLDFTWTDEYIELAIRLWEKGLPMITIAQELRPYDTKHNAVDETWLLLMHLGRQERIGKRPGGFLGAIQ